MIPAALAGFCAGMMVSFLLMGLVPSFRTVVQQRRREAHVVFLLLQKRVQDEVELRHIRDDKMMCAFCWEERHPGQDWPFRWHGCCSVHLANEGVQEGVTKEPQVHLAYTMGEG